MQMRVQGVLETALYVDDLEAAERFYGEVLGLEVTIRREARHVFFRCGSAMLLLFDPVASERAPSPVPGTGAVPTHGAHGPGHVAFAVPSEQIDAWKLHLRHSHVELESEVEWPSGARSLYFRDPAGNSLELSSPSLWSIRSSPGG